MTKKGCSLITLLIITVISIGCSSYTAKYDARIISVERPENYNLRYSEKVMLEFVSNVYEDELLKITVSYHQVCFFTIENKSEHSIKLIWDAVVYIDTNRISHKCVPSTVSYATRNQSQLPAVIAPRSIYITEVLPVDYITFDGEKVVGFFPHESQKVGSEPERGKEGLEAKVKPYIGKTFGLLLPIQIKDVVNEYLLTIKIQDINSTMLDFLISKQREEQ